MENNNKTGDISEGVEVPEIQTKATGIRALFKNDNLTKNKRAISTNVM